MAHSEPDGKLGVVATAWNPPLESQGRELQVQSDPTGEQRGGAQQEQKHCKSLGLMAPQDS